MFDLQRQVVLSMVILLFSCWMKYDRFLSLFRCSQHNLECPRAPGRGKQPSASAAKDSQVESVIDMLVAGSACTDFTSYGSSQNAAGPTMVYLLLLIRLVAEHQPDLLLHENVLPFPTRLLEECLSELYSIQELIRSPETSGSGFPITRNRKYVICRKQTRVQFLELHNVIFVLVAVCSSRQEPTSPFVLLLMCLCMFFFNKLSAPRLTMEVDTFHENLVAYVHHDGPQLTAAHLAVATNDQRKHLSESNEKRSLAKIMYYVRNDKSAGSLSCY